MSKFDRSKKDLPKLKKFEIKYGYEGFEEGNNFLHRNFFRLETNFKRKITELLGLKFNRIYKNLFLELQVWIKFVQ
jgi:hypothetical protein